MFHLLSKEVKLFSIPIYIGLVIFVILTTNNFSFGFINIISNIFAFAGISLGFLAGQLVLLDFFRIYFI